MPIMVDDSIYSLFQRDRRFCLIFSTNPTFYHDYTDSLPFQGIADASGIRELLAQCCLTTVYLPHDASQAKGYYSPNGH